MGDQRSRPQSGPEQLGPVNKTRLEVPDAGASFSLPVDRLVRDLDDVQLAQIPVYDDPTQHVEEELKRLAALIQFRALLLKKAGQIDEDNRFRGLLLKDGELERLLKQATAKAGTPENDPELARKRRELDSISRQLRLREAATLWSRARKGGGCHLPLLSVTRTFRLHPFQYNALILALAPEVDLSFQRMYSHLLNDVTRKRPTVNLALDLFAPDSGARRAGRTAFQPDSALIRYNLLELDPGSGALETSLLLREFKMPERVVLWMLGDARLSPEISGYSSLERTRPDFEGLVYGDKTMRRIEALTEHLSRLAASSGPHEGGPPLVVLAGFAGVGKRSIASRISASLGRPLLVVSLDGTAFPPSRRDKKFRDLAREAHFHGAALCLANFRDELIEGGYVPGLPYLYRILRMAPGLGVMTSTDIEVGLSGAGAGFSTRVLLDVPETAGRIALWEALIAATNTPVGDDVDLRTFALKYGFTGGSIIRVLSHAHEEAVMGCGDGAARASAKDLDTACRIQLGQGLSGIASRVRKMARWEDVILPDETLDTLKEVVVQARFRNIVFHDWGFDRKMTSGKGLSILFSGPPGVGKTMVAGVIATELDMDLFKVDLSQVVSKYVGETEKNLKKVFDAAQGNQFIILFDEADSLFAKRTEVKSSVDRYANLEVNYLLQKMEEYGGISILTTNFEQGIDDAFKRRLNFRIDFPFPEPEDRERLWRVMIPSETPLEDEINFGWLGEKFELAGGNIKNAVLRAAFWAAKDDRPVGIADLELAAEKEAREIGKLVQDSNY